MVTPRAAFVEAACRAYWGRAWDSLPEKEKVSHRAGVMRTMEFLKKQGWVQPIQHLGTQIRQAATEAYLQQLGDLASAVYQEASEPIPDP